jgi:hypothetical protein
MRCRMNMLMALAVLVVVETLGMSIALADDQKAGGHGALFVMTNSTDRIRGNEVVMYDRDRNGDLQLIGFFPTGHLESSEPQLGSGPSPTSQVFGAPIPATADGLGSSNSLMLSHSNSCLFAVNAGSNTVSSFRVRNDGLQLASVGSSQGGLSAGFPVSLTESRNILYVLNSGDQGSLTGFHVHGDCSIAPIAGSSRDLSGLTNSFLLPEPGEVLTTPAQASFAPDGKRLVLSIKGGPDGLGAFPSGRMAVFPVDKGGLLGAPVVTPFSFVQGTGGPFSFIFADSETVIVVHANSQTVASYTINSNNTLSLLSGPLLTGDFAPCWLDGTGQFVYTASFGGIPAVGTTPDGNGILNGFSVSKDGTLTSLGVSVPYPAPGSGHSGNHAIDVRVVGRFLYFIQPRLGMVGRLTIERDGALTGLVNFGGLLPGVEPFAGFNAGITAFSERCFLQDPATLSPECLLGSAQGIAGF